MNKSSIHIHKFSLFILPIICAFLLCGCSLSEGIHSFMQYLGLDMGSQEIQQSDDEITPQIEYIQKEETLTEPSPAAEAVSSVAEAVTPTPEPVPDIRDHVNKTYTKHNAVPGKVTISFAGDVLFSEGCSVYNHVLGNNGDFSASFDQKLLSRMIDSDIFMLNNEFPYSTGGSPLPGKDYTFRADPSAAAYLDSIGTDIVSLANNHAFDYGPQALDDTFKTLRRVDMPYVGAGENINEAIKPAYFLVEDKTICIIGATQIEGSMSIPHTRPATETENGVFRCVDTTKIQEVIADAKSKSDFVIVFIHWGTERTDVVREWQIGTARELTASGADLIIGAHSHCLQGIDFIDDTPVFYSLGNYLFNSNRQDTCLVTLTLDTSAEDVQIDSLQFVPCIQGGGMTVEADAEEKARIIKYEQGISYHALIDDDGYVTYTDTNMNTQNGRNTSPMRPKEE